MPLQIRSIVGALLVLATACAAGTRLEVQRGWGGKDRAGRWNPLVVRVSDSTPRNAILELSLPHEGGFAMVVRERVAIGPTPATFEMYAPTYLSPWGRSVLVLRDANTGRAIAQFPQHIRQAAPQAADLGPQGIFIGISGERTLLADVTQNAIANTAYLPPRLLPRSPIGYDSLEVLFLNQPTMDELDADQQQAILSWVRAGGSLLFTPGGGPLPEGSALTAALPCRVGAVTQVDISPQELQQAGLPDRFAHTTGRVLEPAASARPFKLFSTGHVIGYCGRYGLGEILVAPIDLAALEFNVPQEQQKAPAFWRPILAELVKVPPPQPRRTYDAPYNGYQSESEDQQREGAAVSTLCDFIANAPAANPLPGWLLGLMAALFVVGPVDSIVLFLLGQRPWTWTTTAGWIALIATSAICGIQLVRPNHVEYCTVRVVDQVDNTTISTTDLIGLSSQRTRQFSLEPTSGWWEPATPGTAISGSVAPQTDFRFHQTDAANRPEPLEVGAGRVRFARSENDSTSPGVVEASLSMSRPASAAAARLVGTIRNVSDRALKAVRVRTEYGVVLVPLRPDGTLPPGQTIRVDIAALGEPFAPAKTEGRYQSYGYFGSRHQQQAVQEQDLWIVAPDLSGRRSLRIDALIDQRPDFACIYAESVDPAAAVALHGASRPVQQHYQWIRALVPLKH